MWHASALRSGIVILTAAAAGACGSTTDITPPEITRADNIEALAGPGVVFITMRTTPAESMEALFEGRVLMDAAGCLRIDTADGATVVWPKDYGFEIAAGVIRILDEQGDVIGHVGGTFELGGGEVPFLTEAAGFTGADQDLADSRCPGKYWIANPV